MDLDATNTLICIFHFLQWELLRSRGHQIQSPFATRGRERPICLISLMGNYKSVIGIISIQIFYSIVIIAFLSS